jgi:hypothetical protein
VHSWYSTEVCVCVCVCVPLTHSLTFYPSPPLSLSLPPRNVQHMMHSYQIIARGLEH